MKLSLDQLETIVYFLLYCVALGSVTLIFTALFSFFEFLTARKMLRIKSLR